MKLPYLKGVLTEVMVTTTYPCDSDLNLPVQFFERGCHHAPSLQCIQWRSGRLSRELDLVGPKRGNYKTYSTLDLAQ